MARSQLTVLILEDNTEDAATFRRYLERERSVAYVCHVASTAAEGLELCRTLRPDAILLDYRLPDRTGLGFLAELIAEHGPHVFAVVVITGVGNEAVAVQALKLGAQDYLVKEYDIQQRLILAVASAIDKLDLQRRVEQQRHDLVASNQQLQQALDAQQSSAAQLHLALQSARMATWEWDLATNQVRWGEGLEAMMGLPAGQFQGSFAAFQQLVHPNDLAQVRQRLDRALQSDAPYEVEFRMLRPDGSLRWTETRGVVIREPQGTPTRMIGVDMDVTARKQAEADLLRSEAKFKTLVEHASDVIARFDRDLRHLYVSPSIERATGLTPEMLIGKTNRELGMPAERCALWDSELRQVFETGRESTFEFEYASPEGLIYYRTTLIPEIAADGSVDTIMTIAHDVTDYKQAEERLRFLSNASKALTASLDYQVTLEQIARLAIPYLGDACIIELIDDKQIIDTVVAHIDPQQEELLREICRQYPPQLNSAHPVAQVLRTGQPVVVGQVTQELIAQNIVSETHRMLIQRIPPLAFMMVPLAVRDRVVGVISMYATQAPRRYTADDLAVLEELARRAAMALDNAQLYQEAQDAIHEREDFLAIASHEVKTPLTTLMGRSQLLQRRLDRREDTPRELADIGIIIESGQRINQLLSELLDASQMARGQLSVDPMPLDLSTLIRRVVAQIQPSAPTHRISITEPDAILAVAGDASRLEQVFQNLISNAIKYSPAGGTIEVDLDMQDILARIRVRDQGLGIPADALPSLFKRFYRVARDSSQHIAGSGIGLYVVKEIVTGHGGTVAVSSTEGAGSTFTVYLPLAQAQERSQ